MPQQLPELPVLSPEVTSTDQCGDILSCPCRQRGKSLPLCSQPTSGQTSRVTTCIIEKSPTAQVAAHPLIKQLRVSRSPLRYQESLEDLRVKARITA